MTDDEQSYVGHIAAAVSTIAATVYAVLTGVLSGGWSLFEGLVTLDPSVWLSGAWFFPTTLITQQIGPALLPNLPWTPVFLAGGLAMLGVSFYKYQQNRQQGS